MKILLLILDGIGDRPVKSLGGKTPLEAAKKPNMDFLAENGITGLIKPVYKSVFPTSEECHFSLFGYRYSEYKKARRGVLTALGCDIKLQKNDVALRGNFAAVDKNINIKDRRAGHIKNTLPLIKALNNISVDNVLFILKPAGDYRFVLVLRSKKRRLNFEVSDGDSHYLNKANKNFLIKPLKKNKEVMFTASILNKFLSISHKILENHGLNKKRIKKGLLPANYLLLRGASSLSNIPSFQKKQGRSACCVADGTLYLGIAKILGMSTVKLKKPRFQLETDLNKKFEAAKKALEKYNFVYCHIKTTDDLSHRGDCKGKKEFIEQVDRFLPLIANIKNCLIVITGDHSTSCESKEHSKSPLPVLVYGNGKDVVKSFSEKACKDGGLGIVKSIDFLKIIGKM